MRANLLADRENGEDKQFTWTGNGCNIQAPNWPRVWIQCECNVNAPSSYKFSSLTKLNT